MKHVVLILTLLTPTLTSAGGHSDVGERICREEAGENLMARQRCLRGWQKAAYLVRRYYIHAGLLNEANEMAPLSSFFAFQNPFVLSPRSVIDKCIQGQLFNGNMFSGVMDFREVWGCISEIDPEAAAWDMI